MKQVVVIGAGASGLIAAISAAKEGAAVTVLEKQDRPGRKLLVTGNGKCNLTNLRAGNESGYHSRNPKWTTEVLSQFPPQSVMGFFEKLGLFLKDKNGSVYPYTEQASAVLDALLLECRHLKVRIKCMEKVVSVKKEDDSFQVLTATWSYLADAVIFSTGLGAGIPKGGNEGFDLASQWDLNMRKLLPALVPLKVTGNWYHSLAGVRSACRLTLLIDGEKAMQDTGELQWTDYGISGIVVFQLSSSAVRAMDEGRNAVIEADLFPNHSKKELLHLFDERQERLKERTTEELLNGMLNKKMIPVLLKKSGVKSSVRKLSFREQQSLVENMKELKLELSGSLPLSSAQVCQGGVDVLEISSQTMEAKRFPGLYITGELLDVDGICGGYNLQWAWASGYIAGKNAAKECGI